MVDNPFGYEPVSPYRVIFPTEHAGDIQIMNLPGDFGASIEEMKNAADNISNAVQRMGESINSFAQQSSSFHNDIDSLRSELSVNGSRHVDLSSEVQEMNALPPPAQLNVPPTIIEMNVEPIINKLNEVIKLMKSFDIQINLGNIYGAINQVAQRINFLEDAKKGYPMMLNLLKDVNAIWKIQTKESGC